MSTVNVSWGSALSCSHVHDALASTAPSTDSVHVARSGCGVGPADRTGKSSVTYWPGGTRDGSTSGRRRPWNPREKVDMRAMLDPPTARVTHRAIGTARPAQLVARSSSARRFHSALSSRQPSSVRVRFQ